MTTGLVKIVGIGATGLVAAALADRGRDDTRALDTLVGGAVVAGAANLANLLDLRPGRALKATVIARRPAARAPGRAGARPGRRRRRGGPAACSAPTSPGRPCSATPAPTPPAPCSARPCSSAPAAGGGWSALVALAALTLASEKVSFTQVIESTPGLRELDAWGRPAR